MIRYDHLLAPCDKIEEIASIGRHWPGAIPSLPPGTGSPYEIIRRTRIRRFIPACRASKNPNLHGRPTSQRSPPVVRARNEAAEPAFPPTRGSDAAPFPGPIQSSL